MCLVTQVREMTATMRDSEIWVNPNAEVPLPGISKHWNTTEHRTCSKIQWVDCGGHAACPRKPTVTMSDIHSLSCVRSSDGIKFELAQLLSFELPNLGLLSKASLSTIYPIGTVCFISQRVARIIEPKTCHLQVMPKCLPAKGWHHLSQ